MRHPERPIEDGDEVYVRACQKGDLDAFEVLVRRHQKRMFNVAYRMMGDQEEAANLVQEAFLSAYRGLKRFRGEAQFSTWLTSILLNHSRNRLRQLRAQRSHEAFSLEDPIPGQDDPILADPPSNGLSALDVLEKKELQQKVQECIRTLEDDFREVLILRDIQGFSYEEICHILRLPEGTVKSRLFRAREALRDRLQGLRGAL